MERMTPSQLVIPRIDFNSNDYLERSIELIKKFNVGGFIVFNGESGQVTQTISELQSFSDTTLFFACDAERGLGQIVKGGTYFPFLMSQGAANNRFLIQKQAQITASEMKKCGFNLLFAPVLDINSNPENPIINIRSFGSDPEKVSTLGIEYIKAVQECGVIACAKHFPGHGDCSVDSHVSLPVVTRNHKQLMDTDVRPFEDAVKAGLLMIMLAHASYPAFDSDSIPATFSRHIIKEVLGNKTGFDGIIVSDSFRMGALQQFGAEHEIAIRSLTAGCNLILDPSDPFSLLDRINSKFSSDSGFRGIVERHLELVLAFKKKYLNPKPESSTVITDKSTSIVKQICKKSVCRTRGGVLDDDKVELLIVDIADFGTTVADPFTKELKAKGIRTDSVNYLRSCDKVNNIKKSSQDDTPLVLLIYTSVRAWTEYSTLPHDLFSGLVQYIKGREKTVIVSFGSPYIPGRFGSNADTVILAFDVIPECQSSAARVLTGDIDPEGVLPVSI